jgi:hypothetical protein
MGKSNADPQPNLIDNGAGMTPPLPAFTPIEALRNLVLWHDGDADYLAANRSTIGDMPFGETSFQESLWQVARDIVTTQFKEPQK